MKTALRRTDVILGILLAVSAIAAYWPALGSGFLAYDDYDVLVNPAAEDAFIHDGSAAGLLESLTSRFNKSYLPVWTTSLWLSHTLWGDRARVYHMESCLLHVLNALLVFALVRRIAGRRDVAWGAALTESVAWIAERKGLLAFLFSALAFLAFLRGAASRDRAWSPHHALGALLLGVAMLAKGTALVLPLVLLLYVVSLRWGERRARWLVDLSPYALVALALTAFHYWIALQEGPALAGGETPTATLLVTGLPVLGRYLRLLVLPFWGQRLVPDVRPVAGFEPRVVLGAGAARRRPRPGLAA